MNLQARLETLREKPVHVRQRYAFWASFGFTAIIFAFWLGSFSAFGVSKQAPVAQAVERAGSPGTSLIASVGSLFVDIKDLVFGPSKVIYSSVEVLPGNK